MEPSSGNILVTGAWFHNKGSEAMLLTTRDLLEHKLPGARCYVLASGQASAARLAGMGYGVIQVPASYSRRTWWDLAKPRRRHREGGPVPQATDRPLDYVDAIVDSGGFANSDQHGIYGALGRLKEFRSPIAAGVPMLFMTQSWGPFRRPMVRWLSRKLLKHARLAVARERASLAYLHELDLPGACRTVHAPDMAFHFSGDPPQVGRRLLEQAGCPVGKRPLVGLTPNLQVYWRAAGRGPGNDYMRVMIRAARHLAAKDVHVVVAPHYIVPGGAKRDDRRLCRWIVDALGNPPNLTYLDGDCSARQIKSVIGHLDFLVTSRYHTIVAAFSQRVPCAALGWSHKYDELFEGVHLGDCQIPFGQADDEAVVEMLDDRFENRSILRESLVQHMPQLEQQSMQPFDLAAGLLRSAGLGGAGPS